MDAINTQTDTLNFIAPKHQSSYIKVFGVGGGGGNAVKHMFESGIKGVDFVVCNTDAQALEGNPVPTKIQLGRGLGAGNVPQVAREAALEKREEIKESLANTKMLFITAGMGGGTGTGAAPVVAEIAKEIELTEDEVSKILVVAIVTTPFSIEGKKRLEQAREGIELLRKNVDAILIINNDKLLEFGSMTIHEAFAAADDVLTKAARGIAELITVRSHVQIDFKDVNSVMAKSGVALMGCGEAKGKDRALEALNQAVDSPLLNDNSIRGAKNMLLYYSYGPNGQMRMDEFEAIAHEIEAHTGRTADLIWGAGVDDSIEDDTFRVTLIATGFEEKKLSNVPDVVMLGEMESDLRREMDVAPRVSRNTLVDTVYGEENTSASKVYTYSQVGHETSDMEADGKSESREVFSLEDDCFDSASIGGDSQEYSRQNTVGLFDEKLRQEDSADSTVVATSQESGFDDMMDMVSQAFSGMDSVDNHKGVCSSDASVSDLSVKPLDNVSVNREVPGTTGTFSVDDMNSLVDSVFNQVVRENPVQPKVEDDGIMIVEKTEERREEVLVRPMVRQEMKYVNREVSGSETLVTVAPEPEVRTMDYPGKKTVSSVKEVTSSVKEFSETSTEVADSITGRVENARLRVERLRFLSKMKTAKGLKELEDVPAYVRAGMVPGEPVHSSVSEAQRHSISQDGSLNYTPAFLSDKAD